MTEVMEGRKVVMVERLRMALSMYLEFEIQAP